MSDQTGIAGEGFWKGGGGGQALQRWQSLVNTVSDGIYQLDADGRFVAVDDGVLGMTRYARDDLLGEHVSVLLDESDVSRIEDVIHDRHETAVGDTPCDIAIETADGDRIPCELHLNRLVDGDEFEGTVSVVRDVTEHKEHQRKLEESNERLEQFAYAASHDLQEPLRMVSSYLQLLERRYADELDEDAEEFIEFAVDGAQRMREMIEALLQYSRVDTRGNPFEPVDLGEVFADVRQDLQVKIQETDAEITAEDLPRVYGDGSQLNQVLQNLLDNAIEYSGDDPPRVHVDAERDGDRWIISVSDEGVGIDPADAERVFEVFQSLQGHGDAGTGIGLALVERHDGDIWVDSAPGEGATFSFNLPAAGETDE